MWSIFYSDLIQGCQFLKHGHQKKGWQFSWLSKKLSWLSTKQIWCPCHTNCSFSWSWLPCSWKIQMAIWNFLVGPIVQTRLFSKVQEPTTKPEINDILFLNMKIQIVTIQNDIYLPSQISNTHCCEAYFGIVFQTNPHFIKKAIEKTVKTIRWS